VFRLLPLGFPSYQTLWIVQWIWRASLVLSCAGLFTRSATFVAGICGAYLIALPNNYSNVHRMDAAFVLALLVMALTRSGDAWSLDVCLDQTMGRLRKSLPTIWTFEYKWPAAAVRTLLALSFFAAGFAKLRHRGLEWITTDSLAILLGEQARLVEEPLFPSVTIWLVSHPLLCSCIAAATVLTETLQPLALISRRSRFVLIPAVVLMLLGIRAFQGPAFYPLIALQLFWVDWPWVLGKIRPRAPEPSTRNRFSEGIAERPA
jgi:hypothetical protein